MEHKGRGTLSVVFGVVFGPFVAHFGLRKQTWRNLRGAVATGIEPAGGLGPKPCRFHGLVWWYLRETYVPIYHRSLGLGACPDLGERGGGKANIDGPKNDGHFGHGQALDRRGRVVDDGHAPWW